MTIPSSRDATEIVNAQLVPGEQLLWAGRPKQGFALRGWDILHVPFAVLLAVVGTTFTIVELREPSEPGAIVFALLAALAGFYGAFLRFFVDRWQRSQTFYAVTDQRAIILTKEGRSYVHSVNLKTLKDVTYSRRSDGTGTIEFERPSYWTIQGRYDMGRGASLPFLEPMLTPAFEMIVDAREVRDLILQARDAAQALTAVQ